MRKSKREKIRVYRILGRIRRGRRNFFFSEAVLKPLGAILKMKLSIEMKMQLSSFNIVH